MKEKGNTKAIINERNINQKYREHQNQFFEKPMKMDKHLSTDQEKPRAQIKILLNEKGYTATGIAEVKKIMRMLSASLYK